MNCSWCIHYQSFNQCTQFRTAIPNLMSWAECCEYYEEDVRSCS